MTVYDRKSYCGDGYDLFVSNVGNEGKQNWIKCHQESSFKKMCNNSLSFN